MMRQSLNDSGATSTRARSLPAPVGGWNTLDSIADMNPKDAVFLDNFFPRTTDVMLRKGAASFATLPAGKEIRTLIGYKSAAGAVKIFAAAQDGLYDITAGGASALSQAITFGQVQWVNTTSPGGSFLFVCNGVDSSMVYDGAAWYKNNGTNAYTITGIDPTKIANVSTFKSRIIMCLNNSMSFYYLPINQLGGAASEFALNAVFRKGGYLMATDTWTLDGGNGPDDYFVAISSEGEVAVYKGTDPSSASNFTLVGVFILAQPLCRKCFLKVASDTLVITKQAVYPLSKSLPVDSTDKRIALSRKIERAWVDATSAHGSQYGWQPVIFPEASMLLFNVPILNYVTRNIVYSHQYVMNLMTGAWCRFTGWSAEAMLSFNGNFYFALHNQVSQGWTGATDFGGNIQASAKTAFNGLGSMYPKQIAMVRPVLTADSSVAVQLGIDMDFADNSLLSSVASYTQVLSRWDSAVWNQSVWNGNSSVLSKWRTVAAKIGRSAAVRLRVAAKGVSMTWIATDLAVSDGNREVM